MPLGDTALLRRTRNSAYVQMETPIANIYNLDDQSLKQLVRSHFTPTSIDAWHIRARLNKIQFKLDDLIHAYKRAKTKAKKVQLLEAQRRIQGTIQLLSTLLSPIRILNDDVLIEIFLHLSDQHNAFVSISEWKTLRMHPWSLTEVSRRWRDVATSIPKLWQNIECDLKSRKRKVKNALLTWNCIDRLLSLCLERSRQLPISLHLTIFGYTTGHLLLNRLHSNFHRWKNLTIHSNEEIFAKIIPNDHPHLGILRGIALNIIWSHNFSNGRPYGLRNITWNHLTSVILYLYITFENLMHIFRNLSNATHVELHIRLLDTTGPVETRALSIPSVIELTLIEPQHVSWFLTRLEFPNLTKLWLRNGHDSGFLATSAVILSLLRCSSCPLTKLRVTGDLQHADWIISVIKEFPTITSLFCFPPLHYYSDSTVYDAIMYTLSERDSATGQFRYLPNLLKMGFSPRISIEAWQSAICFMVNRLFDYPSDNGSLLPVDTFEIFLRKGSHFEFTEAFIAMEEIFLSKSLPRPKRCLIKIVNDADGAASWPDESDDLYTSAPHNFIQGY